MKFREASRDAWGSPTISTAPHVEDYLAVSRGLAKYPVHYPRTGAQPDPEGNNFAWFMSNENTRAHRHTLDRPSKGTSLPIIPPG
jgi:hypothetical protein